MGRRHTDLQNLVIGFINEECLRILILSTSIILKGDISEQQVDAVLSTITGCGKQFHRWEEMLHHSHPSYWNNILDPSSMNIGKLGSGGALSLDTCNGARKTCHIIVKKVHESVEALHKDNSDEIRVLKVDCWNHLRNVWLGGMKKALSTLLGNTMRKE